MISTTALAVGIYSIDYYFNKNKQRNHQYKKKFLTLWKDADPSLPMVEDAKTRLEGLKSWKW